MKPGRLLALICLLLAGSAAAQAIAYTVQVVAVSDQSQAFSLIRELGVDGYPAYATRATTEQGDVVRVRVGGFANRAAALLYADTMPDFPAAGNRPLPALADNIPPGVMPFEPRLLVDEAVTELTLLDWPDQLAVEFPAAAGEPHTYRLVKDGAAVDFRAWLAWPDEDGLVLRFRDQPLWPEEWAELDADALQREQNAQLDFIAAHLEVDADRLEAAVSERDGRPVLVVLERFNPWLSLDVGQLLAVSVSAAEAEGSLTAQLLGTEAPSPELDVLAELHSDLPVTELETDQWLLRFDDPFMVQSVPGGSRTWRAAVGAPLWTDGTFVLARHQGRLLIYDFVERR